MIVVITGTGPAFPRLIEAVTRHAHLEAWIQHGQAQLPPGAVGSAVVPRDVLLNKMTSASAVVCHAGCGALADAFAAGHVPVVMARRAHLGEHVNDHQLELLEELAASGRILPLENAEQLPDLVKTAAARRARPSQPATLRGLIDALRADVDSARTTRRTSAVLSVLSALARPVVHARRPTRPA